MVNGKSVSAVLVSPSCSKLKEKKGGKGWDLSAYPLDKAAILSQLYQTLVRNLPAARYVQALELVTRLGYGDDGGFGNVVVARYIQGQHVLAAPNEGYQAHIGQTATVGQSQAFDAGAHGQGGDTTVVDLVGEGAEIQALDKVGVGEVGPLEAKGGADG